MENQIQQSQEKNLDRFFNIQQLITNHNPEYYSQRDDDDDDD